MKKLLIQEPGEELLPGREFGTKEEIAFITTESKQRVDEVFLSKFQKRKCKELDKETITEVEYIPDKSAVRLTVFVDSYKKYFAEVEDAGTRQGGYPEYTIYISKIIITDLKGEAIISGTCESPGESKFIVVDRLIREIEENNEIEEEYTMYYTN